MSNASRPLVALALLVIGLVAILALLPEPGATEKPGPIAAPVAITNVRLFDGENVIESATVVFDNGRVTAADTDIVVPQNADRVDGRGLTLIPGLIDSHVHTFGPARKEALRFGVTTLLDMFRPPTDLPEARAQRQSLEASDRSDLYSAGFLATAGGGHGTQYGIDVPIPQSPSAADAWVAARQAEGSDWIKIVIEDGSAFGRQRPTLNGEMVAALVRAAHARGLLAVAHVSTAAGARTAIESGVDGLVHLFADQPVDPALVELARDADVFIVPTATVVASAMGGPAPDWIAEHQILGPRLGTMQRQSLDQAFPGAADRAPMWNHLLDNLRAFHRAGIPILAGSDAPNPGTAHGASLHQELRLLVEAGLTPLDALRAATSTPARAFRLDQRGCLQPGCRADALLVRGNPLEDIAATAELVSVWKNGSRVEAEPRAAPAPRATASADPVDMLGQRGRWMAASDQFMGGQSKSAIEWRSGTADPALEVRAQVETGFAFPYAGAMWSTSEIPMQPVDHSGHHKLILVLEGDRQALELMVFSGEAQGAPPSRRLVTPGERIVVELAELGGVDMTTLRAVGVFATEGPAEARFSVREMRLE